MHKEKILITGSSGLLGVCLKKNLSKDYNVVGLAREKFSNFVDICVDVTDFKEFSQTLEIINPKYIIHTAAISSHKDCEENKYLAKKVNLDSTKFIADYCTKNNSRLFFISSDAVYSGREESYSEYSEVEPFSYYGELKVQAENAIRDLTSWYWIFRGSFFGRSLKKENSIFDFFYLNLLNDRVINGYNDIFANSLDVFNLSKILEKFIKNKNPGIYNYGTVDRYSKYDFGVAIANSLNFNSQLIRMKEASSERGRFVSSRSLYLKTDKLKKELGIDLPDLHGSLNYFIRKSNLEAKRL